MWIVFDMQQNHSHVFQHVSWVRGFFVDDKVKVDTWWMRSNAHVADNKNAVEYLQNRHSHAIQLCM